MDPKERNKAIIRYSLVGVIINIALCLGKLTVGLSVNSSAIQLDGINSLADGVAASFIIISAALAMKRADKVHPFGYGRFEYLFSLLFAMFIIYIGGKAIFNAVMEIINGSKVTQYGVMSIVVMSVSMVAKLAYGFYARKGGKKINCPSLELTGMDSMADALTALAILVGIAAEKLFGWNIDKYLCIIIGLMILKTGLGMIGECLNKILGTRVDPDFRRKIRQMIIIQDGVLNVSNLVIHDYGEGTKIGSVDIEVDGDLRANEICRISTELKGLARKEGLILTSVGISGSSDSSAETDAIWAQVVESVAKYRGILRAHSFMIDPEGKQMSFYIVEDYEDKDSDKEKELLLDELRQKFPSMEIEIHSSINAL
ncbi:MAG: cation transporter [Spirochaetales bacterium]|nr:cation transporter [Spirochaetales bacterium]